MQADEQATRTARVEADRALRDSEEHFHRLVAGVRDYAIAALDPQGRVVSWNAGAQHLTGYLPDEVLGQEYACLYPPEEVEQGWPERHLAEALAAGHVEHEGWRVRRDGSRFWATVVITAVVDHTGEVRGMRTVTRDVTERHRLEAQLAHQARHDPLTGLANRALLVERLEQALTRLPRHPGVMAVLFLDLDRFKLVNDTLGHHAGDELLAQTAVLLREALRPSDTIARLGGDEFVVLCEDLVDTEDLLRIARRVTAALRVPVTVQGREVMLSASLGVVAATVGRTALQLLRDADIAMYQAKEQGRGRYAMYDGQRDEGVSDRLRIGREMHRALERDELCAHYQPLVDLRTGRVEAVEALVRWQHGVQGLLPPSAFLAVTEDVGTIVDVDLWMVRTACREAAELGRRVGRPLGVWVNLSGRTLAHPGLTSALSAALAESGLEPGLLTLEVSESALMRDAATTVATLTAVRRLGICLAIDDFGTGYSSLSYLQRFPMHALKVDRSFVERLDGRIDQDGSAAVIRAAVALADSLGLRTVAEGIETPAQLDTVTALGCRLGQGFLLSPPGPADALADSGVADLLPRPRRAAD